MTKVCHSVNNTDLTQKFTKPIADALKNIIQITPDIQNISKRQITDICYVIKKIYRVYFSKNDQIANIHIRFMQYMEEYIKNTKNSDINKLFHFK